MYLVEQDKRGERRIADGRKFQTYKDAYEAAKSWLLNAPAARAREAYLLLYNTAGTRVVRTYFQDVKLDGGVRVIDGDNAPLHRPGPYRLAFDTIATNSPIKPDGFQLPVVKTGDTGPLAWENGYGKGHTAGFSAGRLQGRADYKTEALAASYGSGGRSYSALAQEFGRYYIPRKPAQTFAQLNYADLERNVLASRNAPGVLTWVDELPVHFDIYERFAKDYRATFDTLPAWGVWAELSAAGPAVKFRKEPPSKVFDGVRLSTVHEPTLAGHTAHEIAQLGLDLNAAENKARKANTRADAAETQLRRLDGLLKDAYFRELKLRAALEEIVKPTPYPKYDDANSRSSHWAGEIGNLKDLARTTLKD